MPEYIMGEATIFLRMIRFDFFQYYDSVDSWNPSFWKTRNHSPQIVNPMALGDLMIKIVSASVPKVLT